MLFSGSGLVLSGSLRYNNPVFQGTADSFDGFPAAPFALSDALIFPAFSANDSPASGAESVRHLFVQ